MLAPWKKSHGKPRQCAKKQRHRFAHKGPSSQGCSFTSSHVWMWELDHKEGWALKTWCFQTVVLEKTLESPLDCKEIQPVSQFSCSVMADSLWPHGLQHVRLPCPSLSPRVCSNSCPLNCWCTPTVSSSVTPFSSAPTLPNIRVFPESRLFPSGAQSIGASVSVLPMNIQGWSLLQLFHRQMSL